MAEAHKPEFSFLVKPEISFNYLGQFDSEVHTEFFGPSPYNMGFQISQESETLYALSVSGIVRSGQLSLSCSFNKQEYLKSTIDGLMERFQHHLLTVIHHCAAREDSEFTPSDFSASDLKMEEVGDIFEVLADKLS